GTAIFRNAQPDVVAAQSLTILLGREFSLVPDIAKGVASCDIQRAVNIDEGAVEIEEDRFENARCQIRCLGPSEWTHRNMPFEPLARSDVKQPEIAGGQR